jgi:hypothetical protein
MEMVADADLAAMETDNELCVQSSGSPEHGCYVPEHGCYVEVPRKMRPKHGVPIHKSLVMKSRALCYTGSNGVLHRRVHS